ncbi:MAG: DUF4236 domain-containing protein [Proteobacteria bacterium]|nr:DUF4236 domain-containing protein [Pseudomonadota bacterium]
MAFRFRKSYKLAPGVRMNVGLNGLSLSLGPRGAKVNLSSRGTNLSTSAFGFTSSTRLFDATKSEVRRKKATHTEIFRGCAPTTMQATGIIDESGELVLRDANGTALSPELRLLSIRQNKQTFIEFLGAEERSRNS